MPAVESGSRVGEVRRPWVRTQCAHSTQLGRCGGGLGAGSHLIVSGRRCSRCRSPTEHTAVSLNRPKVSRGRAPSGSGNFEPGELFGSPSTACVLLARP